MRKRVTDSARNGHVLLTVHGTDTCYWQCTERTRVTDSARNGHVSLTVHGTDTAFQQRYTQGDRTDLLGMYSQCFGKKDRKALCGPARSAPSLGKQT
jgi:hypothetical protein